MRSTLGGSCARGGLGSCLRPLSHRGHRARTRRTRRSRSGQRSERRGDSGRHGDRAQRGDRLHARRRHRRRGEYRLPSLPPGAIRSSTELSGFKQPRRGGPHHVDHHFASNCAERRASETITSRASRRLSTRHGPMCRRAVSDAADQDLPVASRVDRSRDADAGHVAGQTSAPFYRAQ